MKDMFDRTTGRTAARNWWARDLPEEKSRPLSSAAKIRVMEPVRLAVAELEEASSGSFAGIVDRLATAGLEAEERQVADVLARNALVATASDLPNMVHKTKARFPNQPATIWISTFVARHHAGDFQKIQDNAKRYNIGIQRLTAGINGNRAIAFPLGKEQLWRTNVRELSLAWELDGWWESVVLAAWAEYGLHLAPEFQPLLFS